MVTVKDENTNLSTDSPKWDCGPHYCDGSAQGNSPPPAPTPYSTPGDNYWNLGVRPLIEVITPAPSNISAIDFSDQAQSDLGETAGSMSSMVMWRFDNATSPQKMPVCSGPTPTPTPTPTCDSSDCTNGCVGAPTCTFTFTPTCDSSDCKNGCAGAPTCTFTFTPTCDDSICTEDGGQCENCAAAAAAGNDCDDCSGN